MGFSFNCVFCAHSLRLGSCESKVICSQRCGMSNNASVGVGEVLTSSLGKQEDWEFTSVTVGVREKTGSI